MNASLQESDEEYPTNVQYRFNKYGESSYGDENED